MSKLSTKLGAIAAIGATALGGAALASAATSGTSTTPSAAAQTTPQQGYGQAPAQRDPSRGGHQANGKTEALLTGATADKVKAAALAKVPGATVLRVETDADHGSPYEAHLQKSDGTQLEVLVNNDFVVTAVNTMGGHP
jgi:uncharacterized membrane protein YkoI